MTSFLRLNGITVPVATSSSPSVGVETIGKRRRSANGSAVASRRTTKLGPWKFGTVLKTAAEAFAFRELILGRGHVVNFNGSHPYTTKGMAPASSSGITYSAISPKYGAACAEWTGTGLLTYSFFAATPWTCMFWLNEAAAGWHHYAQTSTGLKWVDGVATVSALPSFSGGLTCAFGSSTPSKLDDIVALPFLVPSTWPAQIYGFGSAFGALPQLTADGLFIEQNVAKTVLGGDEPTGRPTQAKSGGALLANMHDFSFELAEV